MKFQKTAAFIGICIFGLSGLYMAKMPETPRAGAQPIIHWLKCKNDKWCTLGDTGGMGPDGSIRIANYYGVSGTFYIWVIHEDKPQIIASGKSDSLMESVGHVFDRSPEALNDAYVTWTEDQTNGDDPWGGEFK